MTPIRYPTMIGILVGGISIAGCGADVPPAVVPTTPATSALPQLLAVASCPQVEGRVITLATGSEGIVDAFALVKRCTARPLQGEVALDGDAWVWVAVDRDLGAVRVRQFVHAALRAELRVGVHASYVESHLELAVSPRPGGVVSIEPVGVLEVSPLNWASQLALELAPVAGTSVEWVAKRRLREETETAIAAAIAQPLVLAYDARRGETWVASGTPAPHAGGAAAAVPRVRVVPRGTALLGPYPEASAAPVVHLRLEPNARVAVRAVCRSHAERILEADRRGERVGIEDWLPVSGADTPALPTPPCPWMLAMRAVDDQGAVVSTDVRAARGDASAPERGHHWVALDALSLEEGELPVDLQLIASTDVYRRSLVPAAKQKLPALIELSADDAVWVRAVRAGADPALPTIVARARLPLDEVRNVDALVDIEGATGRLGRVRVRARVRDAP